MNASSASNTWQSSSVKRRASSSSVAAALTSPMIAARRAASTKRRLRERSTVPPLSASDASVLSGECDCDDCMVAVSLGTAKSRHFSMRVEADQWYCRISEGSGDRLDLLRYPLSQRAPAPRTVEDDRRPWTGPSERTDRGVHGSRPTGQQLLEIKLRELDHRALGDAGPEDDRSLVRPAQHVPEAEVSVKLRLGDRVRDRHRLELLVVECDPGEAELLEIDLLGRPSVDLLDELAARAGQDRGRPAGPAGLGVAHPERA